MPAKSIDEIRAVFAQAKADAIKDPSLKEQIRTQYFRTLAAKPYNLTLDDFISAHEDPILNPTPGPGPYGTLTGIFTKKD